MLPRIGTALVATSPKTLKTMSARITRMLTANGLLPHPHASQAALKFKLLVLQYVHSTERFHQPHVLHVRTTVIWLFGLYMTITTLTTSVYRILAPTITFYSAGTIFLSYLDRNGAIDECSEFGCCRSYADPLQNVSSLEQCSQE